MACTSKRMVRCRPRNRYGPSGDADGKRRRTLEHHLDEAHKDDHQATDPETGMAGSEDVAGGDVAATQKDAA